MYLKHREDELAESSLNAHRLRLKHFVRWCDDEDIDNLNELTGRRLHEYRLWRKSDGNLNRVSVRTQMSTLRALMEFCAQIDAVETGLKQSVDVPELDPGENARSVYLESDHAERILTKLRKYEYASLRHVLLLLLWRTGVRTGSARAIDVEDVDLDNRSVAIRHQPDYGTPLKNKSGGERHIALREDTVTIFDDWIHDRHPGTEDDHGRTPLLATKYGRISRSNIRKQVYWATSPQFVGDECSCDTDEHSYDVTYSCDDAISPHAVRRGALTHALRSDVPESMLSDRADVSPDVLEKHYDEVTPQEKMELRREYLDNL